MGVDFWFRPAWSVNAPTAWQGVEQRGAEPLLFPQSETFLIVQHYAKIKSHVSSKG